MAISQQALSDALTAIVQAGGSTRDVRLGRDATGHSESHSNQWRCHDSGTTAVRHDKMPHAHSWLGGG